MASGLQKLRDRQKAHGLSDLERPHGRPRRRAGSFRHLVDGHHRGRCRSSLHRVEVLPNARHRRGDGVV